MIQVCETRLSPERNEWLLYAYVSYNIVSTIENTIIIKNFFDCQVDMRQNSYIIFLYVALKLLLAKYMHIHIKNFKTAIFPIYVFVSIIVYCVLRAESGILQHERSFMRGIHFRFKYIYYYLIHVSKMIQNLLDINIKLRK